MTMNIESRRYGCKETQCTTQNKIFPSTIGDGRSSRQLAAWRDDELMKRDGAYAKMYTLSQKAPEEARE